MVTMLSLIVQFCERILGKLFSMTLKSLFVCVGLLCCCPHVRHSIMIMGVHEVRENKINGILKSLFSLFNLSYMLLKRFVCVCVCVCACVFVLSCVYDVSSCAISQCVVYLCMCVPKYIECDGKNFPSKVSPCASHAT